MYKMRFNGKNINRKRRLANIKKSASGRKIMDKRKYSEQEKKNFRDYANSYAPKSGLLKDCVIAYIVGGAICVLGQIIGDTARKMGLNEEDVKLLIPCSLIVLSCILTGLGLYKKIAKYAGAGTIVPITGFANAVCSIAIDSKAEGLVFGVGANMFKIAGPVIVYGAISSVISGIIVYLIKFI